MSPSAKPETFLEVDGRGVRISNPGKVVFPEPGLTKLDLASRTQAAMWAVREGLVSADGAGTGNHDDHSRA